MTRTSALTTRIKTLAGSLRGAQAGFTLVELLVVIALIGLIGTFALPSVNNFFKLSMNSSTREMASIVKETYNSTAMSGKVHRLAFDFKAGEFWVESGPNTLLLDTVESKEKEDRRKKFSRPGEEPKDTGFSLDKSVTRNKIALPRGVSFEDILTEQSPIPITEGMAYVHFFPHGLTEKSVIHLQDTSDHHVTLVISPLIGRTRLIDRFVKGAEAYDE